MKTARNLLAEASAQGWSIGTGLEVSPETGNVRVSIPHNDVYWALDILGGPARAAERLNIELNEVHGWIDSHYVPDRYVDRVSRLSGFSGWSVQKPPYDLAASRTDD